MKKRAFSLLTVWTVLALLCASPAALAKDKVILDSDMVEVFDDGMAMLLLAKSPEVELLGVTTVIGNSWQNEGTAYALRQLEAVGLEAQIPVVPGFARPMREDRYAGLAEERRLYGVGRDNWTGAFSHPEPASWQAVYESTYGLKPKSAPSNQFAPDFIIEQVKKYPGEVTLIVIGTCRNVVTAVQKAPEIVPMIKRVIYMGGAFFQEGNVTPGAEFNWWFDPEAAKIAVRTPFREQVIVPLDVCETVHFTNGRYRDVMSRVKNKIISDMLLKKFNMFFAPDQNYYSYIWDAIAAAIFVDPSLVTEETTLPVDVNDKMGLGYGESYAFKGPAPEGVQRARIIMRIDETRLWKIIFDLCREL